MSEEDAKIGRFQIAGAGAGDASFILVDTVTGRSWLLNSQHQWSPVSFERDAEPGPKPEPKPD